MNVVTSWRGILWSLVAVAASSRQQYQRGAAVYLADDVLKEFDARFSTTDGHQIVQKPSTTGRD